MCGSIKNIYIYSQIIMWSCFIIDPNEINFKELLQTEKQLNRKKKNSIKSTWFNLKFLTIFILTLIWLLLNKEFFGQFLSWHSFPTEFLGLCNFFYFLAILAQIANPSTIIQVPIQLELILHTNNAKRFLFKKFILCK